MKGPDVTLTNGRYEFRSFARGSILYLADPPEAGWRTRAPSDDAAVSAERPAVSTGSRVGRSASTSARD
jgi:hypothetical protein